jgi:hypothetical protein
VSAKRGADWTSSIRGVVESKRRQFDLDNTGAELAEPVNGLVERCQHRFRSNAIAFKHSTGDAETQPSQVRGNQRGPVVWCWPVGRSRVTGACPAITCKTIAASSAVQVSGPA